MDFHEVWKELVIGVIVGLVLMYQQRKLGRLDQMQQALTELDKNSVKWPEHNRDIERIEERHDKSLEKVMDKLDAIQGEVNTNITNLYKLLVEREK